MSLLYTIFIWTVPFLGMLTVIVFFHEMGHFLMGRFFKVPIDAFSIGFGPELLHWTDRHGTRWRLAALPLGGYVKFHGDGDPASMTKADADLRRSEMGVSDAAVADIPMRGRTMQAQEVWKRALIVAAGPAVNFLLAIVIFAGLFSLYGRTLTAPIIQGVTAGSPAQAAGFQPGDTLAEIDGAPLDSIEELKRLVQNNDGSPMSFLVKRAGQTITLQATPRREIVDTAFGPARTKLLGIGADPANTRLVRYGPLQALEEGTIQTWQAVEGIGGFMKRLVSGRESADQLSGPVGIAKVAAKAASLGVEYLVEITAFVSISIGLLNLLPIPILDGGFLMFFAYEAIRGKAMSERSMEIGFRIGLTLIATLSIFALYNDTARPKPQLTIHAPAKK